MKYPKGIKGKIDKVFSSLIRERNNWTCERCGAEFPDAQMVKKCRALDCSHFWGRSKLATRWYSFNAFSHCTGCHRHLSANPVEFTAWAKNQMSEDKFDELTLRANGIKKYYKAELEEMLEHLEAQLIYMERRRMKGETGYIDFVDFD